MPILIVHLWDVLGKLGQTGGGTERGTSEFIESELFRYAPGIPELPKAGASDRQYESYSRLSSRGVAAARGRAIM